ncbi:MAG: phosphate ABC transporter permease PstA [Tepidisphaeraceae bacterium]|jgi:phosphate transport system permease protein
MSESLHNRFSHIRSEIMLLVCILFATLIIALLVLITGYLLSLGFGSLSLDFFTKEPIPIGMVGAPGGMKNGIFGTAILIMMASLVGIPIGMLAGIYLSEYDDNSWLNGPVRFISDVLAGVPSIVVGILGYELLVVPMGSYNGYAGAAALAFIMIPIVCRTTEEMLRLVPSSYREASIGLGATKAATILEVVIPSATGSIVTGVMLAVARVAGETAPLLFTALSSRFVEYNPSRPFPSLTVQVFTYATGPYPQQKKLAWAGILVLIGIIFVLNLSVRYFSRQRRPAR